MGLFKSLTGRSCKYPTHKKLQFPQYNASTCCSHYCRSTDTCLAKDIKSIPDYTIHRILDQPSAYQYTASRHPEAFIQILDVTYQNLCPRLQLPFIQNALIAKRQKVAHEVSQLSNYVVFMSEWLRDELKEIERKTNVKREELLQEAIEEAWYEEQEEPTTIDESKGSTLYYYHRELTSESRNRLVQLDIENPVAYVGHVWISWIFEAITIGHMSDDVKQSIRELDSYYFDMLSKITVFSGAGTLNEILMNSNEPRY
ncbi:TPA: hypothetical protein ACMDXF_004403 [Vibrio parahaemolyticus]|nr:hypothetical protein [Vibrio parahaemolyticus]